MVSIGDCVKNVVQELEDHVIAMEACTFCRAAPRRGGRLACLARKLPVLWTACARRTRAVRVVAFAAVPLGRSVLGTVWLLTRARTHTLPLPHTHTHAKTSAGRAIEHSNTHERRRERGERRNTPKGQTPTDGKRIRNRTTRRTAGTHFAAFTHTTVTKKYSGELLHVRSPH